MGRNLMTFLQASGAYIFRPEDSNANIVSRSVSIHSGTYENHATCSSKKYLILKSALQVPLKIVRGPIVDEVYQQFSPWISQVRGVTCTSSSST